MLRTIRLRTKSKTYSIPVFGDRQYKVVCEGDPSNEVNLMLLEDSSILLRIGVGLPNRGEADRAVRYINGGTAIPREMDFETVWPSEVHALKNIRAYLDAFFMNGSNGSLDIRNLL